MSRKNILFLTVFYTRVVVKLLQLFFFTLPNSKKKTTATGGYTPTYSVSLYKKEIRCILLHPLNAGLGKRRV